MNCRARALALVAAAALLLAAAFVGDAAARWDGVRPVGANAFVTDTLNPSGPLVAVGGLVVTLTWTPTPDLYATGYRVSRATQAGGPYTPVATVSGRTTTLYVDDPPGTGTYRYVVEAMSGGWTSVRSNEASALAL